MKKKLFIILLLIMLLTTGCGSIKLVNNIDDRPDRYSMFTTVEQTGSWIIVFNNKTKVMYAVSCGGSNCGTFTLLVDAEGNPMIYGKDY